MKEALRAQKPESEIAALRSKIESLTVHLEKMYMDKLDEILDEKDFERIYQRVKAERCELTQKLSNLDRPEYKQAKQDHQAKALVQRFAERAFTSREVLVSLIERVELTEAKQIIIRSDFASWRRKDKSYNINAWHQLKAQLFESKIAYNKRGKMYRVLRRNRWKNYVQFLRHES